MRSPMYLTKLILVNLVRLARLFAAPPARTWRKENGPRRPALVVLFHNANGIDYFKSTITTPYYVWYSTIDKSDFRILRNWERLHHKGDMFGPWYLLYNEKKNLPTPTPSVVGFHYNLYPVMPKSGTQLTSSPQSVMPAVSSTFGIHRGLLLVVISVILVASVSVSALPSPQALSAAHQNIRGRPKDVRIPCNFNGVSLFSHNIFFSCVNNRTKGERPN